jgi:hypothetical protein
VLEHGMSPLNVFLNFGDAPPLLATSFKVGSGCRVWAARFGLQCVGGVCVLRMHGAAHFDTDVASF